MEITYTRDVAHCDPSPYVKMVTITSVEHAPNADKLDIVTFEESGRVALVGRGSHVVGEQVMFIPAESVLPFELSEVLNVTNYTSKGKIRVSKIRGNRSEGLVVPAEIVEPYLPHILKWEDSPSTQMRGNALASRKYPPMFSKFDGIPHLLDVPRLFTLGEKISWSRKYHGTNTRFAWMPEPFVPFHLWKLYVGSHNVVLQESTDNIYWKTVRKMLNQEDRFTALADLCRELRDELTFYGEIYGPGIQNGFGYGLKRPELILFAIKRKLDRISQEEFVDMCDYLGLPYVEQHNIVFESLDQIRDIADNTPSGTDDNINEGIVIVSREDPDKIARIISFEYLLLKGRTERH